MFSHWLQKKIKEYRLSRETSLQNGLIRRSFYEGHEEKPGLFLSRGHVLPAALSLLLILVLTLSIWGVGISKMNHEQSPQKETVSTQPPVPEPPKSPTVSRSSEPGSPVILADLPEPAKIVNPPETKAAEPGLKEEALEKIKERDVFMKREARNTVLVDKANRRLFVARRQADGYKILREFQVSVGQLSGNKIESGDKRTPEGIYRIIDIKFDEELLPIYGPMAFVLSYPNDRDKLLGKTGWGIWIHGTGQKVLTPDTKGCVALTDDGILELSSYIAYNTPVFIFPERRPLVKEGERIPISLVNGLEMEYIQELPLLKARLEARNRN